MTPTITFNNPVQRLIQDTESPVSLYNEGGSVCCTFGNEYLDKTWINLNTEID